MSGSTDSIVQYFLLNTPAGEIDHVIADLKVLLNESNALNDNQLQTTLRTYNTQQLVHCSTDQDASLLLTPYNQYTVAETNINVTDDNTASNQQYDQYVDPNTNRIYTVNHTQRTATVTEQTHTPTDTDTESIRTPVQKQLQQYIHEYYTVKKVIACVYAYHSELIVCISGKNTNLANYWTGSWNSVYKYNTINQQLSGQINVQVHYFEDGNVQLHNTHTLDTVTIDGTGDVTALSKSIIDKIQSFESLYQQSLNDVYENMNEITFKQMRRFLPITRSKFAWSNLANDHSLFDVMTKSINYDK